MKVDLNPRTRRCGLALSLLLGTAAVYAANGITVAPDQERLVSPGMTAEQVRQTLGQPAEVKKFHNEMGPTWVYHVQKPGSTTTEFDVDFSNNGQVAKVMELEFPRH